MSIQADKIPTAYIFLNGDFEKPLHQWPERPDSDDLVIAADGGARHPVGLNWPVHCLVGDFDSLDPQLMARLVDSGTEVTRYPAHKNEIDFELSLKLARRRGYESIVVLGALGGRWDMTFGNLFLPRAAGWGSESIRFRHGAWDFFVISGPARLTLHGDRGDLLSLLPLGEDVHGVTLNGCRYPLGEETLKAGFSRGLSNEFMTREAGLEFESGVLMIVHKSCSFADDHVDVN
jgi:thiamine pyrophosphokinase